MIDASNIRSLRDEIDRAYNRGLADGIALGRRQSIAATIRSIPGAEPPTDDRLAAITEKELMASLEQLFALQIDTKS